MVCQLCTVSPSDAQIVYNSVMYKLYRVLPYDYKVCSVFPSDTKSVQCSLVTHKVCIVLLCDVQSVYSVI